MNTTFQTEPEVEDKYMKKLLILWSKLWKRKLIPTKYTPIIIAVFASITALLLHSFSLSFYLLKFGYSIPFLPIKNIDHVSDYYTSIAYDKDAPLTSNNIIVFNIADCERKDFIPILSTLDKMDPKVIGLDVLFKEKQNDSIDQQLLNILKETDNIVLPVTIDSTNDRIGGCFYDSLSNKTFGMVAWDLHKYESCRRSFDIYTEDSIPFFSYIIAYQYDSTICKSPNRQLINYTTLHMRCNDAYDAKVLLDSCKFSYFEKKVNRNIVLLGETGKTSKDKLATPCGNGDDNMDGVLIHAHIVSMLLKRKNIVDLPIWIRFIFVLLCSVLYCYCLSFCHWDFLKIKFDFIKQILKLLVFLIIVSVLFFVGVLLFKHFSYYCNITMYVVAFVICTIIHAKINRR